VPQREGAVGPCPAAHQRADAVGPRDLHAGHRSPALPAHRPHHQLAGGDLREADGVGDEHQRGGTVAAEQRLDQIQAGVPLPDRDEHVAPHRADEVTAAPCERDVPWRLDGLRVHHRIAEAVHELEARKWRELPLVPELHGPTRPRRLHVGRLRRDGPPGIRREHALPALAGPSIPAHATDTVDYAICLEGEIWAVLDEGETLMRRGDVPIQRGAYHAWSNRSAEVCRIAFVLIDAEPLTNH